MAREKKHSRKSRPAEVSGTQEGGAGSHPARDSANARLETFAVHFIATWLFTAVWEKIFVDLITVYFFLLYKNQNILSSSQDNNFFKIFTLPHTTEADFACIFYCEGSLLDIVFIL